MADAMKGTCCCCFYNSVRSLILILSFFCIVSLFANVLLLNFAVVYNDDLLPRHFLTVSTDGIGECFVWIFSFKMIVF